MNTTYEDWTQDIIRYGDSRDWKPLPARKALRKFAEATGTERRTGVAANRALRCGYEALRRATPDERANCTDWQSVLELQATQKQKRTEKLQEQSRLRETVLDALKDLPGWTLLAGEETEVVAQGTLADCLESLPLVCGYPLNSDVGRGCWVIVAPNGMTHSEGEFSRQHYS